jgi:hypothetical protein
MRRKTSRSGFAHGSSQIASTRESCSGYLRVHVTLTSVTTHVRMMSFDYRASKIVRAKGPCLDGQAILAAPGADQDLLGGRPCWLSWRAAGASRRVARRIPTSQLERWVAVRAAACAVEPASAKRDSICSSVGFGHPELGGKAVYPFPIHRAYFDLGHLPEGRCSSPVTGGNTVFPSRLPTGSSAQAGLPCIHTRD